MWVWGWQGPREGPWASGDEKTERGWTLLQERLKKGRKHINNSSDLKLHV